MRILLTNDDGILAAGLAALHEAVADLGELTIVAPESPQSAAGHSITVQGPLLTDRVHVDGRFWGVSVAGRPADCVKLAVYNIMDAPPELVLSGINAGANIGINVLYSGTVAAAAEGGDAGGAGGGVQPQQRPRDELRAGRAVLPAGAGHAAADAAAGGTGQRQPAQPGVRAAARRASGADVGGRRGRRLRAPHRPRGRAYFWLTDKYSYKHSPENTDVVAIHEGYIAVTPLQVDLTAGGGLSKLESLQWSKLE